MVAAFVNVLDIFHILIRAQRAEILIPHDVGKAENGVQRGAQLMAHGGEEFRFGLVGDLGLVLRRDKLVLDFPLGGGVAQHDRVEPLLADGELGY